MTRAAALIAAVLFGAVYACAPTAAPPPSPAPQSASDPPACAARGGRIERVGRAQSEACVIPYADAGKACRDNSECQGGCRADVPAAEHDTGNVTGACAADNSRFGCYAQVVSGHAQSAICVD